MKRIVIILLSSIFLMACASDKEATEKNNAASSSDSEESGIEVDKGLLNVEITLPKMFFEDDELADIEAEMENSHEANVTKNDDGSLTIKMSKKEHKQLMSDMQEEFVDTIKQMIEAEDYPTIKDISYNRNMTELSIVVNKEEFESSFDGFALFSLGFTGLFYQIFNGKDIEKEKVTMKLIDEETTEEFEELIFPDVFDDLEDVVEESLE